MQGPWISGGFAFSDEKQAAQAAKEVDAVDYLRNRLEGVHPEVVHEMYQQITEQKLFSTPVGYSYLKELRDYLTITAGYEEDQVAMIPVEMSAAEADIPAAAADGGSSATDSANGRAASGEGRKDAEKEKEHIREKGTNGRRQSDTSGMKKMQQRARVLLGVNVLLVIAIIAMFLITLTSGNTTILNYENQIIDKYESWEQDLQQREDQLKEREALLDE
ncbi:MAG: hypothetical protein ACI4DO_01365 [Roseburia sp.]